MDIKERSLDVMKWKDKTRQPSGPRQMAKTGSSGDSLNVVLHVPFYIRLGQLVTDSSDKAEFFN